VNRSSRYTNEGRAAAAKLLGQQQIVQGHLAAVNVCTLCNFCADRQIDTYVSFNIQADKLRRVL